MCTMGFFAMAIDPWFPPSSQQIMVNLQDQIAAFSTKLLPEWAEVKATYLASDFDKATIVSFLLSQLMAPPAIKNNKFPLVE